MNEDRPIYKIAIVAPVHIQPSKEWVQSLQSISSGKSNVKVIIVDDSNGKVELPADFDVYDYKRQEEELGEAYPFFERFHKSSSCKNFGHWLAWRDKYDIVMGIDSDCIVPPNFIGQHIEALIKRSYGWTNPIRRTGWFSRGYPYAQRDLRTALSLGLWSKELDLYGSDRVNDPHRDTSDPIIRDEHEVADGFLPLSGMNWACWADVIPALLFLPNIEIQRCEVVDKIRRHDDIWGGYIFQKIMCLRNERIVYGMPIVTHDTVVDAQSDADEEVGMIGWEHAFYTQVDQLFGGNDIEWGMYEDIMETIADKASKAWAGTEWQPFAEALEYWHQLFINTTR
jgi:hypothetical protein